MTSLQKGIAKFLLTSPGEKVDWTSIPKNLLPPWMQVPTIPFGSMSNLVASDERSERIEEILNGLVGIVLVDTGFRGPRVYRVVDNPADIARVRLLLRQ